MKDSIETIWQQGFVDDNALVAPKINDLYNQKSQNIVDKFEQMFDWNLKGIMIGSLIFFAALTISGYTLLGIYIIMLTTWLVVVGKIELKKLSLINKNFSSYEYLKAFNCWLQNVLKRYTVIYRYFYPLFFIGIAVALYISPAGKTVSPLLIEYFPNAYYIFDIPAFVWLLVIAICVLLSVFASKIYQADINIVYGRQFKRLEEILSDMEELRKEQA